MTSFAERKKLTSEANVEISIISCTLILGQIEDVKRWDITPKISHMAESNEGGTVPHERRIPSFTFPSWLPVDLPQSRIAIELVLRPV